MSLQRKISKGLAMGGLLGVLGYAPGSHAEECNVPEYNLADALTLTVQYVLKGNDGSKTSDTLKIDLKGSSFIWAPSPDITSPQEKEMVYTAFGFDRNKDGYTDLVVVHGNSRFPGATVVYVDNDFNHELESTFVLANGACKDAGFGGYGGKILEK